MKIKKKNKSIKASSSPSKEEFSLYFTNYSKNKDLKKKTVWRNQSHR